MERRNMNLVLRVLLAIRTQKQAFELIQLLEEAGYTVVYRYAETRTSLCQALETHHWDVALISYGVGDLSGSDLLALLKEQVPSVPVIIADQLEQETTVHALRSGARDVLDRAQWVRLAPVIEREQSVTHTVHELEQMRLQLQASEARYQDVTHDASQLALDFAELKRREADLRDSAATFRLLFMNNPRAMFVYELETLRCLEINQAAVELYGYSRDEFLGMRLTDILPPHDVPRMLDHLRQARPTLQHTDEWRHRLKNGRDIDVETISHTLEFAGQPSSLVIVQDITSRKRAETEVSDYRLHLERLIETRTEELYRSKERVEAILDSSSEAIILADVEGRFQQANHAFEDLFGYEPDEYFKQPLLTLFVGESVETAREALAEVIAQGAISRIEVLAHRKDGRTLDAEIGLSPISTGENQLIGIVCSLHDITDRKRAEVALLAALQKEKELNELKSRFVSMASHEFRNPLSIIQTAVDTVKDYRFRMNSEQIDARLQKIKVQVKHMVSLLDDVLAVGQAGAGRLDFNPAPLNLDLFCREIIDEFQSGLAVSHPLIYEPRTSCPEAMADAKLLRQIITNLVTNAIKYSPPGTPVVIGLSCDSASVYLEVTDEGIGIPDIDQKHLFEAFHRGSNVGIISGSGLGLTIIKNAVEMHGGTIWFESAVGKGTTFTVAIPMKPSRQAANRSD